MPCYCPGRDVTWFCFKCRTMVPEAGSGRGWGGGGWGLDVSVSCCERGSQEARALCSSSTLRMEYVNFAWISIWVWKLSIQSLSALWNRENGNLECWAATGLRDMLVKLHLAMGKTCLLNNQSLRGATIPRTESSKNLLPGRAEKPAGRPEFTWTDALCVLPWTPQSSQCETSNHSGLHQGSLGPFLLLFLYLK